MRRTPLKRTRRKPVGVIAADIWRQGLGPCVRCGSRIVDGHHAIPVQVLRRHGLHDHTMNKANRVSLCRKHHANHHSRVDPLRRDELPASVFEFAEEVGLTWWLDKHYPVEAAA